VGADGVFEAKGLSPANYYVSINSPKCVPAHRVLTFASGQQLDSGITKLEIAKSIELEFIITSRPSFQGIKISRTSLRAGQDWQRPTEYGPYLRFVQTSDSVLYRSFYVPCDVADLGEGSLEQFLTPDLQVTRFSGPEGILQSGHVYLVNHEAHFKCWMLFRVEVR
jgi:hypothetical protein